MTRSRSSAHRRWCRPPRALRRPGVHLDNVAIVPAHLLPCKATYQTIANQLPQGAVLLILPTADTPEKRILQTAADRFQAKGRHVTTITETSVTEERREDSP